MESRAKRTKPSGQGPRVGHLDTLTGILREQGCVYREMRTRKTPVEVGTKLIYSLKCLRETIEAIMTERLEQRLLTVEEALAGRISARHEARHGDQSLPH
jgi:hypothetical protein